MEFILTHLYRLAVLLASLALGVSWWLAPAPPPAPKTQAEPDAWTVPTISPQQPEKLATLISDANLWGTVEPAVQAPLNEPEWRFVGATVNGSERFVMISIENQSLRSLTAGESLPGGAKILEISEDHLCLLINGKKRKLDLFQ